MKDIISEKLMILATAQNRITEVAGSLGKMDNSLIAMEKSSFELLNNSDKLVCMSKEGMLLADRLKEALISNNLETLIERDMLVHIINEISNNLLNIYNTSIKSNNSSHEIEAEAVYQREYKEFINDSLSLIGDSINSTVACAELILAEY
jgi:hypothetical protein